MHYETIHREIPADQALHGSSTVEPLESLQECTDALDGITRPPTAPTTASPSSFPRKRCLIPRQRSSLLQRRSRAVQLRVGSPHIVKMARDRPDGLNHQGRHHTCSSIGAHLRSHKPMRHHPHRWRVRIQLQMRQTSQATPACDSLPLRSTATRCPQAW